MKAIRSAVTLMLAVIFVFGCFLRTAKPAHAQLEYKFRGCDAYTTDDLEYYGGPFLNVYRATFDGKKLKSLSSVNDFRTDPSQWIIDPDLATVTARVQFGSPGRYVLIMSYTPFVFDVEYRYVIYVKTVDFTFVPYPIPISHAVIQVTDEYGNAVAAGVELEFPGWSTDLDPYAADTDDNGQIHLGCVARPRRTFPTNFDPFPNLFLVFANDPTYGSFCDFVELPGSHGTITVKLKPGGCSTLSRQQLERREETTPSIMFSKERPK